MDQETRDCFDKLEKKIDHNTEQIAELRGTNLATTLVRWVIFPLVSILAGAYGISLVFPGGS